MSSNNHHALPPETSCSCTVCKSMCRQAPCIGTPDEMLQLMEAGLTDQLVVGQWDHPTFGPGIYHLSPYMTEKGCTFLTAEGLCTLHDRGLKPMEGRLAHHSRNDNGLKTYVAGTWFTVRGFYALYKFAGLHMTEEQIREKIDKLKKKHGINQPFK